MRAGAVPERTADRATVGDAAEGAKAKRSVTRQYRSGLVYFEPKKAVDRGLLPAGRVRDSEGRRSALGWQRHRVGLPDFTGSFHRSTDDKGWQAELDEKHHHVAVNVHLEDAESENAGDAKPDRGSRNGFGKFIVHKLLAPAVAGKGTGSLLLSKLSASGLNVKIPWPDALSKMNLDLHHLHFSKARRYSRASVHESI